MSVTLIEIKETDLPDTPYNLWVRGELDDFVQAPEGSKVEVIGGKVVVSPPPGFTHNAIADEITYAFNRAKVLHQDFPWRTSFGTGVSMVMVGIDKGYVPDLMIVDQEVYQAALDAEVMTFVPDQIELVVEVTSKWNAESDRPSPGRREDNKWNAYAAAEIPYYLLVDREPKTRRITLHSIPDQGSAAYLHQESWDFGQTIHLPDPFSLDIETGSWRPWRG